MSQNFKEFTFVTQKDEEISEFSGQRLLDIPGDIDLTQVEAYMPFANNDGVQDDSTMIYMRSGAVFCVTIPFTEFKTLMYVINNKNV